MGSLLRGTVREQSELLAARRRTDRQIAVLTERYDAQRLTHSEFVAQLNAIHAAYARQYLEIRNRARAQEFSLSAGDSRALLSQKG